MRRFGAALALAAALVVVTGACSGGGGSKKDSKPSQPAKAKEHVAIAPLTGLPDATRASVQRPALEVKVENADQRGVRPQAGLDQADVVYEEVVEGEITRFLAIFNSRLPETVGPIRSVRATDPNLVWPLGGVFAYSGGAPPNIPLIQAAPVNAVDETKAGGAMFRDASRAAPHNLFGRPADLVAKGGQPVPPPALFQYRRTNQASPGDPVAKVHIGFSNGYDPTYQFDASTKTWKRFYGIVPFNAASGQQVAPTNVVVQFTDYQGGVGNPTAEGQTIGEGDVWVFADGKVVKGRWKRPAKEQPAQYVDATGQPITLLPGTTWVHLVPVGAAVDVSAPAPPASAPASTATATTKKKP
jgi:hypothetical protein